MSNPTASLATLAKLFNLTERRIQQLARDGIIPKPERNGRYDLVGCVQGYIKYLQDRSAGRTEIEPQDTYIERARLLKAQADKTELEVKAMNGELIAADEVESLWSGLVASFRSRLLALPVRCAHKVLSLKTYPEIESTLRAHVFEALSELSRYDPADQPPEPAAGDDEQFGFESESGDDEPAAEETALQPDIAPEGDGHAEESSEPVRPAAEPDDQPVGGQLPLFEQRE
jgi:phage terminase Nu1 subunit (DNA packaging protein)